MVLSLISINPYKPSYPASHVCKSLTRMWLCPATYSTHGEGHSPELDQEPREQHGCVVKSEHQNQNRSLGIRRKEKSLFITYSIVMTTYSHYIIQVPNLYNFMGPNGGGWEQIRSNKGNK